MCASGAAEHFRAAPELDVGLHDTAAALVGLDTALLHPILCLRNPVAYLFWVL